MFTHLDEPGSRHGDGHHGERKGKALASAKAAGAQHGHLRPIGVAELTHEIHKIKGF